MAKAKKKELQYDESSMQHHEGLDGIRKRPTMYIGMIGSAGVMHLFREGIDNSFDEAKAGFCKTIFIYIDQAKRQFMIQDDGRGIPIGSLRDVLSKIHMGGKFDSGAYRYSSGLNGVGTKAINALSIEFAAKVKREQKEVQVKFAQGRLVEDTRVIGKAKKDETGTTIIWTPDASVLEEFEINPEPYMDFCEKSSFLIPNLKIEFNFKKSDGKMIQKSYFSKNGLFDYMDSIVKAPLITPFKLDMEKVYTKEINLNFDRPNETPNLIKVDIGTEMDVYITYTKQNGDQIISFTNGIQTKEGGTHETGCKMGLTKVINKYITDNKLKNKKDEKLEITGDDCRDGLVMIINSRISDPKYDSQTKEKITNSELMSLGNSIMTEKLTEFFNKNPKEAKAICLKAINSAKGRLAAERAKSAVVKKNESIFSAISSISKFADCECTDPRYRILFVVEGDSAGGSVIDGRDTMYHAVYKLKGKPLNGYDNTLASVLKNKELRDLITILGCGIGDSKDMSKLNFHYIVILSDSDADGYDIKSLLDGFFFKYYPEIIEGGYLYHALPPLYGLKNGQNFTYIKDKESYNKFVKNKIESEFILGTKAYGGEKLTRVKLDKVTNSMRRYRLDLNDFATEYGVEPVFVEHIVLNSTTDKEIKAFCKTNKLKYTDGLIEGMYGDKFVTFFMTSAKTQIAKIKKYYDAMNIWNLQYKKNDGKDKFKKCTLSEFLDVSEKCIPKNMQRYKGLGEMDSDQLFNTTLDLTSKDITMIQVILEDFDTSSEEMEIQLGGDADKRKVSMAKFEVDPDDLER